MATTPLQGWPVPGGGDAPANASAYAALGAAAEKQSVQVYADATSRDAAIATGARKAGMVAYLKNLGAYTRVNVDGGPWLPFIPGSWQRDGAAISGITNPTTSVANTDGLIFKSGQATFFTSLAFGNEYGILVNYGTAFPNACLSVTFSQIYVSTDTFPYAGAVAFDTINATQHRLLYVGGSASTKRSYLWTAVGY